MKPVIVLAEHIQGIHGIIGVVVDLAGSRALIPSSGATMSRIGEDTHVETIHRFMERSQVRRSEPR